MDDVACEVQADGHCAEATIANIAQTLVLQTRAVASLSIGVQNQDHIANNVCSHSFTSVWPDRGYSS
jgi:hypothetical protein